MGSGVPRTVSQAGLGTAAPGEMAPSSCENFYPIVRYLKPDLNKTGSLFPSRGVIQSSERELPAFCTGNRL